MNDDVWLVSKRFDLWMFLGSAVLALSLIPVGAWVSPSGSYPLLMWLLTVLFIDVAHVWSTIFRSYLDPDELRRRPWLYSLVPLIAFASAFAAALHSVAMFWTFLAYMAVYHFVRQQFGWVALLNRKDAKLTRFERYLDVFVIYASTVFPVVWWHGHLPRRFNWFVEGDFIVALKPAWVDWFWPFYILGFVLFLGTQLWRYRRDGVWRVSKIIVVVSTALCWGLGIIAFNSDWAFTVTNVIIHGIPYIGIIWVYGKRDMPHYKPGSLLSKVFQRAWFGPFLWILVLIAYLEEYLWDRGLWDDRPSVFPGPSWELSTLPAAALMALLAMPQLSHYILDAFIWRTRKASNPRLDTLLIHR